MQPGLAESWNVSPNGLTNTFHLADTKWQDRQPVTSEDVKFTLEATGQARGSTGAIPGDATLQNYSTGCDPVLGIARAYTTDSIKKGTTFNNASGYSNPEIDQLFVAGQNAPTPEERSRPYFRVQEILAKDMPTYALHQAALQGAAAARLKNL